MAKHYVTVTVAGCSVDQVNEALLGALGPVLEHWRATHLLGVHIDVGTVVPRQVSIRVLPTTM